MQLKTGDLSVMAEEALRDSEAKFRAVLETMIEACCIFEMIYDDQGRPVDWRILEANAGYEKQSGLKDVAGKLASEVMPGTEPYWIETFARVAETGQAEQIERWHQPTGRWVHSSTARVGGPDSRRLASVFYDTTERKRAEEALGEELRNTQILHDLSTRTVTEDNIQTIFEEILAAAIAITGSDAGTVQVFDPDGHNLVLLVTRGIPREMTEHFHTVDAASNTACGIALRTGARSFLDFDQNPDDGSCMMHVAANLRSAQATPLLSRDGSPIGMLNTHWQESGHRPSDDQLRFLDLLARQAADLIEQRRALDSVRASENRARFLLADLQHRVRNILFVVRSVFTRTVETGESLEEIADHFRGRLDALARTQAVVAQNSRGVVDLENMIREELLSVGASDGPNLSIKGPDVELVGEAAESLGLVVHELTTNSIKYGALRHSGAKLKIRWSLDPDEAGAPHLVFNWVETGVPVAPGATGKAGFGTELITQALPYRLGAETNFELRSDGVRCLLDVPMPAAHDRAGEAVGV